MVLKLTVHSTTAVETFSSSHLVLYQTCFVHAAHGLGVTVFWVLSALAAGKYRLLLTLTTQLVCSFVLEQLHAHMHIRACVYVSESFA